LADKVVAPILHGLTDVLVNGIAVLRRYKTAATLVWVTIAAHSLDFQVSATATVLELCLLQLHLLAQTQLITFMNVGYVAVAGLFHTAMAHWVLCQHIAAAVAAKAAPAAQA
jgi:hypothetical protein